MAKFLTFCAEVFAQVLLPVYYLVAKGCYSSIHDSQI